jgi:hypothetical protein
MKPRAKNKLRAKPEEVTMSQDEFTDWLKAERSRDQAELVKTARGTFLSAVCNAWKLGYTHKK